MISGQNEVEMIKIVASDLSPAQAGYIDAVPTRFCLRALVRRIADVPVARSGAIKSRLEPYSSSKGCARRPLGHRRSTDIAKADE